MDFLAFAATNSALLAADSPHDFFGAICARISIKNAINQKLTIFAFKFGSRLPRLFQISRVILFYATQTPIRICRELPFCLAACSVDSVLHAPHMDPCILAISKMDALVGFRRLSMKLSYRPLRDLERPSSVIFLDSSHKLASPRLFLVLSVVSFISILLNLATFYIWLSSTGPFNPPFPQALYSPAQDVLEYKAVRFHSGFGPDLPIYDQPPSDEVDRAWAGLYEFAYSKVPRNQAIRLPNKTYPILGDKPATYMLALDVFHELHCLDEMRKAMYPDYYPATTEGVNTSHMRHCLSSLRQSIMCTADISTIVWQWSEKSQAAKERSDILHTCRDFSKIQTWGQEHFAGAMQDMSIFIPDDLNIS